VILLLDAHALLWWLEDNPELADSARRSINDPVNDVVVSAGTVWEIEVKRRLGKLDSPDGIVTALEASSISTLPITAFDAERAAALPPHHRDPFDRMLIAQAGRLDATIVTRDRAFALYDVAILPA
jgi:PIN domain nuclease of toxin-antitoxin system